MVTENQALGAKLGLLSARLSDLAASGHETIPEGLPVDWLARLRQAARQETAATRPIVSVASNKAATTPVVPEAVPTTTAPRETLEQIGAEVAECQLCDLSKTRTNTVFGVGDRMARLMFIGEAPGADEDRQGEPFVGRAGKLLTDMIAAMGFARGEVYIANILKCRPPGNRDPLPSEVALCEPYLKRQIALINPEVICALGGVAAKTLLQTDRPVSRLRGEFHSYQGIPLLPTYHPAYLLRNPSAKKEAWEDLKMILKKMGLPIVATGKKGSDR